MTHPKVSRRAALMAGLGAGAALPGAARGQSPAFPNQPVRLLLPQGPGSGGDTVARILADTVSRELGQPLVLESRPGANGLVAINALNCALRPNCWRFLPMPSSPLLPLFFSINESNACLRSRLSLVKPTSNSTSSVTIAI